MANTKSRRWAALGAMLAAALLPLTGIQAAAETEPIAGAPAPTVPGTEAGDVGTRIVGGTRASISDYPWAVYLTNTAGSQFCGGALVAPNKVVSAAHCTINRSASAVRVVAGREDKNGTAGVVASVTSIWNHPDYRSYLIGEDVSVLTLDRDLPYETLPLATPADTALYEAGTTSKVLGWGATSSGGAASRYLLEVDVPVTSDATCAGAYSQYNSTAMVCAGFPEGGYDACQGDSGGPLVVDGKLIGIVSWGNGCAWAGYPGVYARVSTYAADIQAQLG
nr:serine protease [Actinoalloteichus spitiensis]